MSAQGIFPHAPTKRKEYREGTSFPSILLSQVEQIAGAPKHVFVDRGYRGHGYTGDVQVHVDKKRHGRTPRSLWSWMKRRAAIESGIGYLKREHRMDRNRLKGIEGDRTNALRYAAGMNFRKL